MSQSNKKRRPGEIMIVEQEPFHFFVVIFLFGRRQLSWVWHQLKRTTTDRGSQGI